jgi:excisionase family DNA binding protein
VTPTLLDVLRGEAGREQLQADAAPCHPHDLLVAEGIVQAVTAHFDAALARLREESPPPARGWFSVKLAASYASVSARTIRRALARGELAYSDVSPAGAKKKAVRIARTDLDDWLRRRRVTAAPPQPAAPTPPPSPRGRRRRRVLYGPLP